MTNWNIGWAEWHQHFAELKARDDDHFKSKRMKMTKGGGGSRQPVSDDGRAGVRRRPFELRREDLPRGGDSLAAQIGAELRAVYAPPIAGDLPGADVLLAQMDGRHDAG